MSQNKNNKQQAQNARNKAARKQEIKTLLILGSFTIGIVAGVVFLFYRLNLNATPVPVNAETALIRDDSPTRGPADAPVTLIEFLDPECESCRAAYPIVEKILEEYEGKIRYVVRYIPNHSNSALAVAATEAAGEQGKYWEMQELLFAKQLEWGEQVTPQTALFISYAESLGLDMDKFMESFQHPKHIEKAKRDQQDATSLGLRGTPTFIVNGRTVFGMNEGTLRSLIEEALQGSQAN